MVLDHVVGKLEALCTPEAQTKVRTKTRDHVGPMLQKWQATSDACPTVLTVTALVMPVPNNKFKTSCAPDTEEDQHKRRIMIRCSWTLMYLPRFSG